MESLWKDQYPQDTLFDILEHIIANVAMHIHPQKNQLLWNILFKNLTDLEEKYNTNNSENISKNFELVLKLIGQMVEHRNGKHLQDPTRLIQQLVKLLSLSSLSEDVLIIIIQITISILLSKNIRLPQEQASQIIRKILSLNEKKVLLYFVDNVSSCSSFEMLILPTFLRKCGVYNFDRDCIYTLTKLVLKKSPLCGSGINLSQWNKYSLDFKETNQDIFEKLISYLNMKKVEDYFCALVCLPHLDLKSDKRKLLINKLHANLSVVLDSLENVKELHETKKCLFWLNISLESIIHLEQDFSQLKDVFPRLFDVLLKYASDAISLKSLSLLFTILKDCENVVNTEILQKLNAECENNFSSPFHEVSCLLVIIYKHLCTI